MKREFLKNLGLTDEQVNQIMTENGNDIEKYRKEVESKTKELETLNTKYESAQNSLNDANKQIKSYKDMDIEGIKNSAAEWEKKYKDESIIIRKWWPRACPGMENSPKPESRETFYRPR